LILIGVQCIIFAWFYDLDKFIPILNENGHLKVGTLWKAVIKYILPIFLIIIWVIGIVKLFGDAEPFELIIDAVIIVAVLVVSFALTKYKATN